MIKTISKFESKFSVSKATFIIGTFTLLAKIVGLYRERLLATHIGVGTTLDIYYASFRIPDFIFNLLILGTLSVAFIPVFSKYLLKSKEQANELANSILNFAFLGMAVVCLILFIFIKPITRTFLPGFEGVDFDSAVNLTRLLLLSPLIFTVANVTTSILQSLKKFLVVTFAASLYNVGIIFGYFFFYDKYGLMGLGYGVLLGAMLLLAIQIPAVYSSGFFWRPYLKLSNKGVREVGKLFLPRIFGLDSSQLSLLIGSSIGSLLSAGSITILNLANNLQFVPVSIFALSTAVASFPVLSENFAKRDFKTFTKTLEECIVQILYIIIPTTVLILIFRAYIVRLVYGAGKFNWNDTILTFQTLGIFSFALVSQSLIPLFSRAFYSMLNTKIPVIIGVLCMGLNVYLAYQLSLRYGVVGIAFAFVLTNILNCFLLFLFLHTKIRKYVKEGDDIKIFDKDLLFAVTKIIFASFCMGLVSYVMIYALSPIVNTRTVIGIAFQSGVAGTFGAITYLVTSYILGLNETQKIIKFFDAFLSPKLTKKIKLFG